MTERDDKRNWPPERIAEQAAKLGRIKALTPYQLARLVNRILRRNASTDDDIAHNVDTERRGDDTGRNGKNRRDRPRSC